MRELLNGYVESVFGELPENEETARLKTQMHDKLHSSYDKSIRSGKSTSAAYAEAISDISELNIVVDNMKNELSVQDKGFFSEGMEVDSTVSGVADAFGAMSDKERKAVTGALTSSLWLITVIIYILISMLTGWWEVTWLIFLIAAAADEFFRVCKNLYIYRDTMAEPKSRKKAYNRIRGGTSAIMWLGIVLAYFIISFITGWWNVTWIIYLVGAIAEIIIGTAFKLGRKDF